MDTLNHYDRIQKYLSQQLSTEQVRQFKSDLSRDADLEQEYAAVLAAQKATDLLAYQGIKNIIKEEQAQQIKVIKKPKQHIWAAAASILLLIFALVYWLPSTSPSPQALAQEYFEKPISSTLKGKTRTSDLLQKAEMAYEKEDYLTVISSLKEIKEEDALFSEAQFILGNACFKSHQPEAAIQAYRKVLASPNSLSLEQAEWNLIMAYLYQGKIDETEKLLSKMEANTSIPPGRKTQIRELLKSLPKNKSQ